MKNLSKSHIILLLQFFFNLVQAHDISEVKGYECIKIFIAIRLNGLKGLMMYKEGVALKRKIVFPLFRTINVCGEKREREEMKVSQTVATNI